VTCFTVCGGHALVQILLCDLDRLVSCPGGRLLGENERRCKICCLCRRPDSYFYCIFFWWNPPRFPGLTAIGDLSKGDLTINLIIVTCVHNACVVVMIRTPLMMYPCYKYMGV